MIFYFSGTGNSLHLAASISRYFNDELRFIPEELEKKGSLEYLFEDGDILGFVYPVHAWGVPEIVLELIGRMEVLGSHPYVFSVSSCGQEEGWTTDNLKKHLERKGIHLSSGFTVKMPNSYILGYDVEPQGIIVEKLAAAEDKILQICRTIELREEGVFDLVKGSFPIVRSGLVHPIFNRFAMTNKSFFADEKCDGCRLCQDICPMHSIRVTDKPTWSGDCILCLGCLNRCPRQAIQYGKKTSSRGRYVHPDLL